MREIKFRGKRIDNGEWVYGYFLYGAILDQHVIWTDNENWIVDPETVGQFVDFDKNRAPIFEGDIDGSDEPMYVAFEDGSFGLKFKGNRDYFDNCITWRKCLIIGNIHDDSELLRES